MNSNGDSRGYGITRNDVEASRLVFVSLRNSLPKRKVAVPVPDGFTWSQFTEQVKAKLKLNGIISVCLASSGEAISSLDGLEDIDELLVEEGVPATAHPRNGNARTQLQTEASLRTGSDVSSSEAQYSGLAHSSAIHRQQGSEKGNCIVSINEDAADVDNEEKYIKRSNFLKRMGQRLFPNAFSPSMPISSRNSAGSDEKDGRSQTLKRRRHKGKQTLSTLMMGMIGSTIAMVVLYWFMFP